MIRFATPRVLSAALMAGALLVAGCNKSKDTDKPAELTELRNTAQVQRIWSASTGGSAPELRVGLSVALDGESVFAAGIDGEVVAHNLQNGTRLWQTKTKLRLTGGPGAGAGLVVVGASHGDIIALDAATGAIKWKARINSEILSTPAVSADVVLLRAVDGRLTALRAADGTVIWNAEQQVPRLSLRGTGDPIISGDLAVSGFDNGRVLGLALKDGGTAWEAIVAPPSGRTELQRLVDIDSAIKAVDADIYAVTYQGKVARIDRDSGQVWWSRDLSSYSGLATDDDGVYVTTAEGAVVKIGRRTGVELWKQEVLSRRRLSPPVVVGSLVAVADLQGYVHFMDGTNGELVARIKAGGDRVSAAPVTRGDMLVVLDDGGHMTALRVVAPKAVAAAPAAPAVPAATPPPATPAQ
jgi:outer membrane protein assembly factor BamB